MEVGRIQVVDHMVKQPAGHIHTWPRAGGAAHTWLQDPWQDTECIAACMPHKLQPAGLLPHRQP